MLDLFKTFKGLEHGDRISLTLNRMVVAQNKNIDSMVTYYKNNLVSIDMQNPILRLINTFYWEDAKTPMDFYNRAYNASENLSLGVGITTSNNSGNLHKGYFYGEAVNSFLIYENNPDNVMSLLMDSRWKKLKPIRVLTMPGVNGSYVRPDLVSCSFGYATIAIDIPLLAFMYKGWSIDNLKKPYELRERTEHFIGRYLFPSMMYSQMDCILINSLSGDSRMILDEPTGIISLPSKTKRLLDALSEHIEDVTTHSTVYEKLLSNIPSFVNGDMANNLPRINDRFSITNAGVCLSASLMLMRVCAFNISKNPEQGTVENLYKGMNRYITSRHIIEKMPVAVRTELDYSYSVFKMLFLD